MTRKEYFNVLRNMVVATETLTYDGVDVKKDTIGFIDKQIDQLNKRSTSKKPTKKQTENEDIKNVIREVLTDTGSKMTVSEMISDVRLSMYSSQKITTLVYQMVNADDVVLTKEKKVSYFSIPQEVEEVETEEE